MTTSQSNQALVLLNEIISRAVPNDAGMHVCLVSTELYNITCNFIKECGTHRVEVVDVIPDHHPASRRKP